MKNSMTTLAALAVSGLAQQAQGGFTKIAEYAVTGGGNNLDITRGQNGEFFISASLTTYNRYNSSFTFVDDKDVLSVGDLRTVAYVPGTNRLYVGDINTGIVREVDPATGSESSQFTIEGSIGSLTSMTYAETTNTFWVSLCDGTIQNRTLSGGLISSFVASDECITGVAYDSQSDLVLAMVHNGTVREYTTDGTDLGPVLAQSQVVEDPYGITYDSETGILYATSNNPHLVTAFQDVSRTIPEPSTLTLATFARLGLAYARRRRAFLEGRGHLFLLA